MAKSTVIGAFFIFRQPERQLPTVTTKSNIGTLKDKNQRLLVLLVGKKCYATAFRFRKFCRSFL
ncbi:MAG: hypothetical protein IJ143_09245 [Neisseriaceae bacterium]|nr:hypothetical protein [Neisseriaceae bacterium]